MQALKLRENWGKREPLPKPLSISESLAISGRTIKKFLSFWTEELRKAKSSFYLMEIRNAAEIQAKIYAILKKYEKAYQSHQFLNRWRTVSLTGRRPAILSD